MHDDPSITNAIAEPQVLRSSVSSAASSKPMQIMRLHTCGVILSMLVYSGMSLSDPCTKSKRDMAGTVNTELPGSNERRNPHARQPTTLQRRRLWKGCELHVPGQNNFYADPDHHLHTLSAHWLQSICFSTGATAKDLIAGCSGTVYSHLLHIACAARQGQGEDHLRQHYINRSAFRGPLCMRYYVLSTAVRHVFPDTFHT